MTFKDMMLGSAVAALMAGGAVAQSSDTLTDPLNPSVSVEATAETDAQESDVAAEAEGDVAAETDTEVVSDTDADAAIAPEADVATAPGSIDEMTVEQVVGQTVTGADDETIGEIESVVGKGGGLEFVIGVGGFLGLGEHVVAVPADQFSVDENGTFKLASMTRTDVEAQPEFNSEGAEVLPSEVKIGGRS